MRIRKNAKLSSLMFAQGGPPPSEMPSAYMCQLNQSPWDVIPFTSLPDLELDSEDFSLSGNGSWVNDPAGTDSGMGAMMVVDDIQVPKQDSSFNCDDSDNEDNDKEGSDVSKVRSLAVNVDGCRKSNGKGWHCRKAPKEGHYLCDHHFKSQKNQNSNIAAKNGGSPAREVSGPRRRGRPPKNKAAAANKSAAGKSSSSSNQFYYYYSGFGPLWGKHRNDKGATGEGWESSVLEESSTPTSPSSLQIDDDDVVDEDELSGDTSSSSSSSGGGRKRTRKPVKARSLKSLM